MALTNDTVWHSGHGGTSGRSLNDKVDFDLIYLSLFLFYNVVGGDQLLMNLQKQTLWGKGRKMIYVKSQKMSILRRYIIIASSGMTSTSSAVGH